MGLSKPEDHDGWSLVLDVQQTRRKQFHALYRPDGDLERFDRSISRIIDAAHAIGVKGPIDLHRADGTKIGQIVRLTDKEP